MGLSLKLKREFLRCISRNSLRRFRNGFIGQNRSRHASLSTAAWQPQQKIRLFWQKSSLPGVLLSRASRLLSVISVLDDSQQRNQDAHRDEERVIVRLDEFTVNLSVKSLAEARVRKISCSANVAFRCLRISSKLQLCDSRALTMSRRGVGVGLGSERCDSCIAKNFLFFGS